MSTAWLVRNSEISTDGAWGIQCQYLEVFHLGLNRFPRETSSVSCLSKMSGLRLLELSRGRDLVGGPSILYPLFSE